MKKGKILLIILSALIGIIFIFSAWSKTYPIQYFEYIIESQLHFSHLLSAIAARFFIGLEGAIGILMLINIYGFRRWILKACLLLLIIFSAHLVYLLIAQGNEVNCGCMGSVAPMSPIVSLLKNAGLIIGVAILLKWHKNDDGLILNVASFIVTDIIIAVPFFLFPIESQLSLPLSKLYAPTAFEQPVQELRKGKHVLSFMSLSCTHCRHAAGIMAKMKRKDPALPFYFILAGGEDSTRAPLLRDFMQETKADNVPHHFMSQKDFVDMINMTGSYGVPVILWMQDTTIIRKVGISEVDAKEIEAWLKQ